MEIIEVSSAEYHKIIPAPYHIFGSSLFNQLNEDKCEAVYYLLFKDSKYRLGLIGGVRDNVFTSPFSAPFGAFLFLHNDIRISAIDEALAMLNDWADAKGFNSIQLTLPPAIYHPDFISKQMNSLFRSGYQTARLDLNYAFNTNSFANDYESMIWYNARKNLKIAFAGNFNFKVCDTLELKMLAYQVIQQNREARGFPLRMTWEQVLSSVSIIPSDFFLVFNQDETPAAAAIVFHITPNIVQVIYWGDLPQFAQHKTMNFLSYKVFEYYHQKQIQMVDIGPSTENSIPNHGLCEFKESIGCSISPKFTFLKNFTGR